MSTVGRKTELFSPACAGRPTGRHCRRMPSAYWKTGWTPRVVCFATKWALESGRCCRKNMRAASAHVVRIRTTGSIGLASSAFTITNSELHAPHAANDMLFGATLFMCFAPFLQGVDVFSLSPHLFVEVERCGDRGRAQNRDGAGRYGTFLLTAYSCDFQGRDALNTIIFEGGGSPVLLWLRPARLLYGMYLGRRNRFLLRLFGGG